MAKVIKFPTGQDPKPRKSTQKASADADTEARRLMTIADEIDAVILKHLNAGLIEPADLAGLVAHRLGNLMRHIDHKSELWDLCEKVLKNQAAIE